MSTGKTSGLAGTASDTTAAKPASSGTGGSNGGATEDVRRKAADVQKNVQELGGAAKAAAQEAVTNLQQRGTEYYQDLQQRGSEYYQMSRDRVSDAEQSLEDYIRTQPIKSVLIAAGVGFFLGACYLRR